MASRAWPSGSPSKAGRYTAGDTARVVGCVVHGVPAARPSPVLKAPPAAARPETAALRTALGRHQLQLIAAVPHRPELTWRRVADMVRELNREILHEGDLSRRIKDVAVFAQGIPGGIRVLDDGRLIVVPGDRHEVVMAACLAAMNGIRLAALLLSGGIRPDPWVWELAEPAAAGLPVLLVEPDSYETATRVRDLGPRAARRRQGPDRERDQHHRRRPGRVLAAVAAQPRPAPSRTPAAFLYQLVEKARTAEALIVLPEGTEPRTLRAAIACADRGIAGCLLLGAPDEVALQARHLGLWLPHDVTILDQRTVAERYVAALAELRRHKGTTEEIAREHLADPITVGTMMVKLDEVDGMVSGAVHTTANTVRPALQILGAKRGTRLVSSIFFMCLPDGVVIYGDCAINP